MIKLFAATSANEPLADLVDRLTSHPGVDIVGVGSTGRETVAALRGNDLDALVVSERLSDIARALRISGVLAMNEPPSLVAAADGISPSTMVRSLAYGFDSILPVTTDSHAAATRLVEIVDGHHRLTSDAEANGVRALHGLLARALVINDPDDRHIADLVGAGLNDHDIATTTARSIQDVRNRVEGLMAANNLTARTHLAIMRAAQVVVPDFG